MGDEVVLTDPYDRSWAVVVPANSGRWLAEAQPGDVMAVKLLGVDDSGEVGQ